MVMLKQLQHSGIQKSPQRPQKVELIKYVEEQSIPGGLATETTGKENSGKSEAHWEINTETC